MTSRNDRTGRPGLTRTARATMVLGVVALGTGLIAALWMRDWRVAVTGVVLMVVAMAISGLVPPGDRPRD